MALSLNTFAAASADYEGGCVEKALFLSPGVYACEMGDTLPILLGPFRGQGRVAHAPEGARAKKRRFPRPRRKRLGYGNLQHERHET